MIFLLLLAQDPVVIPPLREVAGLVEPRACAFGRDGRLYVADAGAHRVAVFGPDGKPAGGWGRPGAGPGEMLEPSGIAAGPDGEIYVSDRGNGRVQIFDPEGRFLHQWGGLIQPRHVERYGNRVYVTETDAHRVRVFGMRGEPGPSLGDPGAPLRPAGAAADEAGTVYVADAGQHRVRRFSKDGAALGGWGSWGQPAGFLSRPGAVAWHAGRLFVADTGNHRIQVFDPAGKLVRQWGAAGIRPRQGGGHLHAPAHVAVSPDGAWAAVAEPLERRVQVFPLRDLPAAPPWYGAAWWERFHAVPAAPDPAAPKPPGLSVVVAVPDLESHSVFFVDVTENTVSRVVARAGGFGVRLGLFNSPASVAYDPARRMAWVADAGNRRIQLLALGQGASVRAVAAWDFSAGVPGPLALDGGRLLALDASGSVLEIFDTKDLSRVRTIRLPEGARGEGLAGDGQRVYVADGLGARILVFDDAGKLAASWGHRGSEPGDFLRPAGVAVDAAGQIHVVDVLLNEAKTFDASGRFLRRWGGTGAPVPLHAPASIRFGRPDHLLIDDAGQHMGQVFKLDGRSAGFFLKTGIPFVGGSR